MSETNVGKVGYLESAPGRKSSSRLNIIICAFICVIAALSEVYTQVISTNKIVDSADVVVKADWTAIAALVGVLLIGNGAIKVAQKVNIGKSSKP